MPNYDFSCYNCLDEDDEPLVFTITVSMKEFNSQAECPECGQITKTRVYDAPPIHMGGLTAAEKRAGTTKKRADMGKHFKNEKEKRKKDYGRGTREGDSNEFWVGGDADKKAFKK